MCFEHHFLDLSLSIRHEALVCGSVADLEGTILLFRNTVIIIKYPDIHPTFQQNVSRDHVLLGNIALLIPKNPGSSILPRCHVCRIYWITLRGLW